MEVKGQATQPGINGNEMEREAERLVKEAERGAGQGEITV